MESKRPILNCPQKQKIEIPITSEKIITIDSTFDSGNVGKVSFQDNTLIIYSHPDCNIQEKQTGHKSWFYFSVQGYGRGEEINLCIRRTTIIYGLYSKKNTTSYRPVYKIEGGEWNRWPNEVTLDVNKENELEINLKLVLDFDNITQKLFIAFLYPYSYTENIQSIAHLERTYQNHPSILFKSEVLCYSLDNLEVHLLTITSKDDKSSGNEAFFNENLFPEKKERPKKFPKKPVVLLTSRVHPGETTSSHAINGTIKFLLNTTDPRALLLRKNFVFMIVPMINVDGVYRGHYRLDSLNQNLNRYYKDTNIKKHPTVFGVKKLIEHLNSEKRLCFFCDYHGHGALKSCFVYGNHMNFNMQVESKVFTKLLSLNTMHFDYNVCNFSKKHMKARDSNEKVTKEGCARVFAFKKCNIPHSYTLEVGFHKSTQLIPLNSICRENKNITENPVSNIESEIYASGIPLYTIEIYEDVGKNLAISILDLFEKNPHSRVYMSKYKRNDIIRSEIAQQLNDAAKKNKKVPKDRIETINEMNHKLFYSEHFKSDNSETLSIRASTTKLNITQFKINKKDLNGTTHLEVSRLLQPSKMNEFEEEKRSNTKEGSRFSSSREPNLSLLSMLKVNKNVKTKKFLLDMTKNGGAMEFDKKIKRPFIKVKTLKQPPALSALEKFSQLKNKNIFIIK